MIGRDSSTQSLGIVPCAISWLFKLINERKEKTGTRFCVRVSAVEIFGKDEELKDLLSEASTGSLQEGQSPGIHLREDPICGTQVSRTLPSLLPDASIPSARLTVAVGLHIDFTSVYDMIFRLSKLFEFFLESRSVCLCMFVCVFCLPGFPSQSHSVLAAPEMRALDFHSNHLWNRWLSSYLCIDSPVSIHQNLLPGC